MHRGHFALVEEGWNEEGSGWQQIEQLALFAIREQAAVCLELVIGQ